MMITCIRKTTSPCIALAVVILLLAVLILLSASAFAMDAGSGGVAGDGHVGEPSIFGYTAGHGGTGV